MEIIKINSSSAISKINFNTEKNLVGISFTYNENKEYLYICEDIDYAKEQILTVQSNGGSVGKLINSFRKDGTFIVLEN